jgi:hypothetical protein
MSRRRASGRVSRFIAVGSRVVLLYYSMMLSIRAYSQPYSTWRAEAGLDSPFPALAEGRLPNLECV